jgi:hypothetical protein
LIIYIYISLLIYFLQKKTNVKKILQLKGFRNEIRLKQNANKLP